MTRDRPCPTSDARPPVSSIACTSWPRTQCAWVCRAPTWPYAMCWRFARRSIRIMPCSPPPATAAPSSRPAPPSPQLPLGRPRQSGPGRSNTAMAGKLSDLDLLLRGTGGHVGVRRRIFEVRGRRGGRRRPCRRARGNPVAFDLPGAPRAGAARPRAPRPSVVPVHPFHPLVALLRLDTGGRSAAPPSGAVRSARRSPRRTRNFPPRSDSAPGRSC